MDSRDYFLASDYHKLWSKEVQEKKTVRKTPLPRSLIPHLGGLILEIGVGEGRVLRYVSEHLKYRVYIGLDISADILCNLIGQEALPVDLVQADGTYLPFRDRSFTGVLCIDTSWYISDKRKLFQEISRVLKEGGCFLCNFQDLSLRTVLYCLFRKLACPILGSRHLKCGLFKIVHIFVGLLNKLGVKSYGFDTDWLRSIFTYGLPPSIRLGVRCA